MSDRKMIFALNLELKFLSASVASANIENSSLKSLLKLFYTCLDHVLVKFEQNRMVKSIQNFKLFDRKPGFLKLFLPSFDAILEEVSVSETIVEC